MVIKLKTSGELMGNAVLVNGSRKTSDKKVGIFEAHDFGEGFERQTMGHFVDEGTEVDTSYSTTSDGMVVFELFQGSKMQHYATDPSNIQPKKVVTVKSETTEIFGKENNKLVVKLVATVVRKGVELPVIRGPIEVTLSEKPTKAFQTRIQTSDKKMATGWVLWDNIEET